MFLCLKTDLLSIYMQFHLHKTQTNSWEQNCLLMANCYCIWQVSKIFQIFESEWTSECSKNNRKKKKIKHHTIIVFSFKKAHNIIYYQQAFDTYV